MMIVAKRLTNTKLNKKGSMALEIVTGVLILILVLSFFIDLILIGSKYFVGSQNANYVVRKLSLQGGVKTSTPSGYPGGNKAYLTSNELYSTIKANFNNAGIKDGEFIVTINGVRLTQNSNIAIDYLEPISCNIKISYDFKFISSFIPGDHSQTLPINRSSVSEYKYGYDSWIGE